MGFSKGLKSEFNNRGKRAISVRATESLLLYDDTQHSDSTQVQGLYHR